MNDLIELRKIKIEDCQAISNAYKQQGWTKPTSLYRQYFDMQESGERDIIIATKNGEFAGYLTINWASDYPPFEAGSIPEIVDFNVLHKFQRLGIGTKLMDEAEKRIKRISNFAGIGFGIFKDYGAAQILYIRRGYIPDGEGIVQNSKSLLYGDTITVDDSIALFLTKKL